MRFDLDIVDADITVRRYDNCLKYLMELVKRDYKVDDMLLREVNGELVRKFDLYPNDFFRTFLVRDEVFSNNSCLWKVKKEDLDRLYRNLDLLP